jgi:acyl carrier protein
MSAAAAAEPRIQRIFREQLAVEVPDVETDLFESGALDSLSFVDLLVALADEFGREISIERLELADFRSIAAMARWLASTEDAERAGAAGSAA